MTKNEYGIILDKDQYLVDLVIGTQDDGKNIMFATKTIPRSAVVKMFNSKTSAQLWVANQKIKSLENSLKLEKESHLLTKIRAKTLFSLVESLKENL